MRLPSSSSLLLASLVVSSSSSLSALAAPVGDSREDSPSNAHAAVLLVVLLAQQHAPIPPSSDDTISQPNNHLQTRNLVDKLTAPLTVPPELPDILHAILDPLVRRDTPKARGETLDPVKTLVPTVKTIWAEEGDEGGDDAASEDSFMWPSPAAGHEGAPVAGPNPPAGFLRQPPLPRGHAGRQVTAGGGNGEGEGSGGNVPSPPCQCPP